jgi:putative ABC transport system substrate-binding protein
MVVSADPIAGGVVDRIAQPGGNVTGLTLMAPELAGKRLELLREVAPRMRRAAAVVTSRHDAVAARWLHDSEAAAGRLGLGFRIAEVGRGREQWDAAFAALRQDGVGGVTIVEGPRSFEERSHIAASALKHGLATALPFRAQVEAGGLLSYGANLTEMYRRAATLADKILRGTPPSAIPVEQPTKFDLVINLGTAKALGLTIPPSLLVRADQVIE